jgi:hypothetical protein
MLEEHIFTVGEIAEKLQVKGDTIRRLFLNEPGVIVICFPRKGKRVYRTVRIPDSVLNRVLARLSARP